MPYHGRPSAGGQPRIGDDIVRAPRATDAIGHTLRGCFGDPAIPGDMQALLRRLDRVH